MAFPLPGPVKELIRNYILNKWLKDRHSIDEVFNVDLTYDLIKRNNICLRSAVDIGANTGQWYQVFLRHFPGTRVLSIEANPDNLPALREINPDCLHACLAETAGVFRTFYLPNPAVERVNTGASLYKEVLPGYENPICLRLETSTLDDLNRQFDLIKLDVQGAELDVLRGGEQTLRKAKLIMIEIGLTRYNQNAPLGAEVISYLHENGFFLLAINESLLHRQKPIQLDCCFAHSSLAKLAALDA